MKTFWEWLKTRDKKVLGYFVMLAVVGALLMVFGGRPTGKKESNDLQLPSFGNEHEIRLTNEPASGFLYERELEKRLEEIFSLIEGAGKIRVMVSPLPAKETVFAVDANTTDSYTKESDSQGGSRETRSRTSQEKTVTITDRTGTDRPLVLREIEPKIAGVIIIAEGGDSVFVKDALTKAATTVLGIEANKVQVLKMRGE